MLCFLRNPLMELVPVAEWKSGKIIINWRHPAIFTDLMQSTLTMIPVITNEAKPRPSLSLFPISFFCGKYLKKLSWSISWIISPASVYLNHFSQPQSTWILSVSNLGLHMSFDDSWWGLASLPSSRKSAPPHIRQKTLWNPGYPLTN